MTVENTEWPVDPGPAGGFSGDPGAGGNTPPPSGDPGVQPGSPTPPPGQQPPASATPNGEPAPTVPAGYIPQYRLDQVSGENKRLRGIVQQLLGGQAPPNGEPKPPLDPRLEAVRGKILELFPFLKDVEGLVASNGQQQQAEERRQNAFATRTIGGVLNHCAGQLLGEGKGAKDLTPEARTWLKDSFISWVLADDARAERYDAGDTAGMAAEFWTAYNQVMRATAVRTQQTTVLERGQRRANLPTQGSSAAPVPPAPPALNFTDEKAVHKAGWAAAQPG